MEGGGDGLSCYLSKLRLNLGKCVDRELWISFVLAEIYLLFFHSQ